MANPDPPDGGIQVGRVRRSPLETWVEVVQCGREPVVVAWRLDGQCVQLRMTAIDCHKIG